MNRVVIESPYAGDTETTIAFNLDYARRCLRHSLDQGEAPFASHLLYTQPGVLDDTLENERLRGLQAAYEWTQAANIVAFYIDHGWSPGMIKALRIARLFKRKIEVRSLSKLSPTLVCQPAEVRDILKWSHK